MKDSYSFDLDDEGLQKSYDAHRDAYIKIFDRLGFEYVIVHAMSGAMGGSASEEFLAVAANGEDTFVRSPGGYAANVEAVKINPAAARSRTTTPPPRTWRTPRTPRPSRPWWRWPTPASRGPTGRGRPPTPSRTWS